MGFCGDQVLPRVVNVVMNSKENNKIRSRVCGDLTDNVVEIGFGTGLNLPYLSADVKRLQAVEPSRLSVKLARGRIAEAAVPVEVVGLDGQLLPLPDSSADSLLCTAGNTVNEIVPGRVGRDPRASGEPRRRAPARPDLSP